MYQLRASHDGKLYPIKRYYGYSYREALKKYRAETGLTGKHNVKFYTT